jgi:hypothetical protein
VNKTQDTVKEVDKVLPLPEPPPSPNAVWAETICTHITSKSNMNDQTNQDIKPKIATIVYDNAEQYNETLDHTEKYLNELPIHQCIENEGEYSSQYELQQPSMYRTQGIDDDESYDNAQATIKHLAASMSWNPTMNTIIEETPYDKECIDNNTRLTASNSLSGKQRRQRQHYHNRKQRQLDRNIAQAIDRNGIYRVNIHNAQNDGGANRSVTSSKSLLVHFEEISDYGINGVKEGEAAIVCTGRGFIPWRANSGEIILIRCLYCAEASGTIISPSDVNAQYVDRYGGWTMMTDHDSKTGIFKLLARDGINHLEFTSYSENNLWFHYLDQVTAQEYKKLGQKATAIVRTLSVGANYELWHNLLGHPGEQIMTEIHKHISGVPKLKCNKFYSCSACISAKFRKNHIGTKKKMTKTPTDTRPCEVGQHLHADFGFVRGSDWSKKTNWEASIGHMH